MSKRIALTSSAILLAIAGNIFIYLHVYYFPQQEAREQEKARNDWYWQHYEDGQLGARAL